MITNGITLITEGYAKIGFGHIRRSITLARELARSVPVQIWVVSESSQLEEQIATHFKELNVRCGPLPDQRSEVEIVDLEPDSARRHLSRTQGKVSQLCLDYFNPEMLPAVTVNLFDHSGEMEAAYCAAKQSDCYMEGPEYAIIRPSIQYHRPLIPPVIVDVNHLVLTFGGADPAGNTLKALLHLKDFASSSTDITIILGPLTSSAYERQIRAQAPPNVAVLWAPDNYDAIVATADVVLSSGGGSLLESLCLAKPTVVFPQTTAEDKHARFHVQANACVLESDLHQVLSEPALRNTLAANAHSRVDGHGVERIAEMALKLLSER